MQEMTEKELGHLIREARASLNLSQRDVADAIDCTVRTVGNIEAGRAGRNSGWRTAILRYFGMDASGAKVRRGDAEQDLLDDFKEAPDEIKSIVRQLLELARKQSAGSAGTVTDLATRRRKKEAP